MPASSEVHPYELVTKKAKRHHSSCFLKTVEHWWKQPFSKNRESNEDWANYVFCARLILWRTYFEMPLRRHFTSVVSDSTSQAGRSQINGNILLNPSRWPDDIRIKLIALYAKAFLALIYRSSHEGQHSSTILRIFSFLTPPPTPTPKCCSKVTQFICLCAPFL